MGRKKRSVKPLDTIWEVPDELWARTEPILLEEAPPPPPAKRREEADRLAAGAQRDHLPHAEWLSMESVAQTIR
jgi:hypothetical protein